MPNNNWLNRTTKQYSVNSSASDMTARFGGDFTGYASNPEWIYDPDTSAVAGEPNRYWVITGDVVTLMDQAAQDAVDAAIAESTKDSLASNLDRVLKSLVLSLNDGSFVPNSGYTNAQIKAIIKSKL